MLSHGGRKPTICFMLFYSILCFQARAIFEVTKDQTTSRANTLFDDADDIQRQLENEVRDRYGQFKTVWVFHVPSHKNLQGLKQATTSNDITVRLKRKLNKTPFNVYEVRDLKEECHCENKSDAKSGEACKCSECKCAENTKKEETKQEKPSFSQPTVAKSGEACKAANAKKEETQEEEPSINQPAVSKPGEVCNCSSPECKCAGNAKNEETQEEEISCSQPAVAKPGEVCKCSNPECKCAGNANKEETQEEDPSRPVIEAPPQKINQAEEEWTFWDQQRWHKKFKYCGGRAQSPVNLPVDGLIHAKGARKLIFSNYDIPANNLTVVNDGKRVVMYGNWPKTKWPLVYGGAAHSRRYLFHSLSVYWPSEHPIGGIYYPMETQLLHISAEYGSYDEALKASSYDPLAFLGVINIYKFAKTSHEGVTIILEAARKCRANRLNIAPMSLENFSPPFSDHVCYYGSLTTPPCTESVLWLVRRRSLPLTREVTSTLQPILKPPPNPSSRNGGEYQRLSIRVPQPLNDRKVYLFV